MPKNAGCARPTLAGVETFASLYASRRAELSAAVDALEQAIADVKRSRLQRIRDLVSDAVDARDRLHNEIHSAALAGLFSKPKTRTFFGIRVGLKKAKDIIAVDDEERTIRRIRELLPNDQAELLIRRRESLEKAAVFDLAETDLKRLGIRLIEGEDEVFIKPQDSEVSKLVDALLGKGEELDEL